MSRTRRVLETRSDPEFTEVQEHSTDHEYEEGVGEEQVVERSDPAAFLAGFIRSLGLVLLALLAIAETLLGFRFAFLAAAANPNNDFVDFIYDSTGWLVGPFEGIVANTGLDNGGVIEWATPIAMMVYALAVLLIILLLNALASLPAPARRRSTVTHRTRHEHRA